MTEQTPVVNLKEKFARFHDLWSPRIVVQVNDLHVKVVKARGEFVWHSHPDTDEFFLVHSGRLTIRLRGREDVTLEAGELFVVPRGTEHCPVAEEGCELILLEPAGVVNTGDAPAGSLTAEDAWI